MTEQQRLHIRVAGMAVGTLGRGQAQADSVFTYSDNTSPRDAVSLTMPPRLGASSKQASMSARAGAVTLASSAMARVSGWAL